MAKKPAKKEAPAKAGTAPKAEGIALGSMPLPKGASVELTDSEWKWLQAEIDRIEGLESTIKVLAPQDLEIVKQALGASIGFSNLQRITRDIESWSGLDDWTAKEILYYLRIAQTGYKLALRIGNSALSEQQKLMTQALMQASVRRKAGAIRWVRDPKGQAMAEIRSEWERRQRPGAAFAREMASNFQQRGVDITEGGIKNAIGRWRKESSS